LISSFFSHNSAYYSALFNNQLKGAIIFLLFKKVTNLSQYMLKIADTGKIVNMLANDFNNMETKLNYLLTAIISPIILIGIIVLIVYRLGWWGLMCLVIPVIIIPIQGLMGKLSG
jgi:ABC-type multidrug transport system fused ATPase/permease subunit